MVGVSVYGRAPHPFIHPSIHSSHTCNLESLVALARGRVGVVIATAFLFCGVKTLGPAVFAFAFGVKGCVKVSVKVCGDGVTG